MKIIIITIIAILFATQIFAQNITADTILAKQYFETAKEFYKNRNYDTAAIYFEKSSAKYLEICQTPELWQIYGYNYMWSETRHGKCYQKQKNQNKAIAVIKFALKNTLLHLNEKDTIISDSYHALGYQYYKQVEIDSTLFYWNKTYEIRKSIYGEKHVDVAKSYNNLGIIYGKKNEYELALQHYLKAVEIKKELIGENNKSIANSYNNIGIIYWNTNEFELSLEYHFKALQIRKELLGENHSAVASSYSNIGIVYSKKHEYNLALQYHFKALQIRELLNKNNSDISSSYNNIGVIYWKTNENDLALEYYKKSLKKRKELFGNKHSSVAKSYHNIALIYSAKKKYDLALEYNFKALKIKQDVFGEKHTEVAYSYSNIGAIYEKKEEYDLALEYYLKALQIRTELFGNKHIVVAVTYLNIGYLYNAQEEYDLALLSFQKTIASSLRNFNDTININAVPPIKNYLNWNRLLETLHLKAKILSNDKYSSSLEDKISNQKLALLHYQACDTLISQVRKEITTEADKIALGEQANKIYKDAVNVCLSLNKNKDKSELDYNKLAFYFSEKNKSSVLLEALSGTEALQFAGIPDSLLILEKKLSLNITNYINLKNNEKNDSLENIWNDRLFKSQRSYDSLIAVYEIQYPEYYNLKYNNSPTSIQQVSNLLDKKTAILSYSVGDSTITIFAISKKDFVITQIAKPDSLDDIIFDYHFYISETGLFLDEIFWGTHWSIVEYEKIAFQLYNLLFPPEIQIFLKGGLFYDIENLIIIPDGQLAIIPFETLHTKKYVAEWTNWKSKTYFAEMPYLIKNYNISYNYSATLFKQTKPKQKTDNIEVTPLNDWLAFAPIFDDKNISGTTAETRELLTFEIIQNDSIVSRSYLTDGRYVSPLPGSKTEIETIFKLYEQQGKKALIRTHQQANENFVKSDELQNYRIIHFATHGFVNEENPNLSGILFAQDTTATLIKFKTLAKLDIEQNEGILYQSEIYNLDFNAELVVLSACETALGKITKGEGVIGLTRALLYAGSKNIIVSLWSVSDNSTSDLMISFYENLLSEKPDRSKRPVRFSKHLSDAKRKMIEEGKYSHPYYWSPFILIGE